MFAALIGAPCDMELEFTNEEDLLRVPIKKEGSTETDVREPAAAPLRALLGAASRREALCSRQADPALTAQARRVARNLVVICRSYTSSPTRRMSAVSSKSSRTASRWHTRVSRSSVLARLVSTAAHPRALPRLPARRARQSP